MSNNKKIALALKAICESDQVEKVRGDRSEDWYTAKDVINLLGMNKSNTQKRIKPVEEHLKAMLWHESEGKPGRAVWCLHKEGVLQLIFHTLQGRRGVLDHLLPDETPSSSLDNQEKTVFIDSNIGLSTTTTIHIQEKEAGFEARQGFAMFVQPNMSEDQFEDCEYDPFHEKFHDNFVSAVGETRELAIEALQMEKNSVTESMWA